MMDDFDDGIDREEAPERGNKTSLIAIMIGIIGIVVGVTGIVLANQAQKSVKALEAGLAAKPDKTQDIQKSVDSIEERLLKLGDGFVKLGTADRQIQENTRDAFNQVSGNIRTNRESIEELAGKMTELVEKLENWSPTTARVATTPTVSGDGEGSGAVATEVAEEGIYVIQSGDTLSKVAKKFGVSLNALLAANPSVNPRGLQIGQKIVIPQN